MQPLPLRPDVITGMINIQLGQSIAVALAEMYHQFRVNFLNVILASIFFLFPAVAIVVLYGMSRSCISDRVTLLVASFAPLPTLLVGWDLSRFLVATVFTAILAVLFMETVRPAPSGLRWPAAIPAAIAGALLFVPFVWAFFWQATINDNGMLPLSNTFIGKITQTAVHYFSHR